MANLVQGIDLPSPGHHGRCPLPAFLRNLDLH